MTLHYCKDCPLIHDDCGPWDDECEFKNIFRTHKDHKGFQIGEPKLRGKENWGHTEIEKEVTIIFNQNINRWFHELVADLKGPEKICLIKKWVSQS